MLKISKQELVGGVTVYGDDTFDDVFYPIPEVPRFRTDDHGDPVLRFLKYRMPLERSDGKRGGGFVFFDTEFTFTPDELARVKTALDERVQGMANSPGFRASTPGPAQAHLGTMTYTRGTANLLLKEDGGTLIEAVRGAGKPSLFGRNIAAFMVEFTPEGATLFEAALQGKGGVVQVVYDLYFVAKLPETGGRAWFEADKFYSYEQTVDIDWQMYGDDEYVEKIREEFIDHEAMGIELRLDAVLPDPEADRKLKDRIRAMLERALQDAVLRKMIPDIEAVPTDERGVPEDIEHLRRSFETNRVSSFEQQYRENSAVEWNIVPQGTLPNITTMADADGKPVLWTDHATEVDLNDPFFQTLHVKVGVNADFATLPIHSIEVKLEYDHGSQHKVEEYSFASADDVADFTTFIDAGSREYRYSYQVNYVGSAKTFVAPPVTTTDTVLTVNVDDVGLLDVEIGVGDIDFTRVASAQVWVRYSDDGVEDFEEQFALTQQAPTHRVQHVLFQPRRNPVRYQVEYFLTDGRRIQTTEQSTQRSPILVNDPLGRTRKFEVRGVGDFTGRISQIFLDLAYTDAANDYTVEQSVVLSAGNEAVSQPYAVLGDGAGVVSYSGTIRYLDGTVKPIPPATADGTIMVGDVVSAKIDVTVVPDLVDWTQVRLVQVALRHGDGPAAAAKDLIFSPQVHTSQRWELPLGDGEDPGYSWSAVFFLADGSQHPTGPVSSTAPSLVLQPPVVAPAAPPVAAPPVAAPVPAAPVVAPDVPVPPVVATPVPATPAAPVVTTPVPATPVATPATPPPPTPGGTPPPPPVPGGTPPPPPVPGGQG
jgi:hypothetical protein